MTPPPVPRPLFRRDPDTHKGDYGHVLVVGGSIGLTGAPILCARAALRSGAGLVTLAVPEPIYFIAASQMTEVMVRPLPESPSGTFGVNSIATLYPLLLKSDVLAIGPGLSQSPFAQRAVVRVLESADLPVVLDADGINAFAGKERMRLRKAKGALVITPHPGEMARLVGTSMESVQKNRVQVARKVAKELHLTVVLKGHRTVVASPTGEVYLNSTGNPGMATAGMGDLLTGMIAALIGQGLDPFAAAKAGATLHGLAGDLAARRVGQVSLIASDLLDSIPEAFRRASHR